MAELNEAVADAIEVVAEHTDEFASAVRDLSKLKVQYALLGAVAGAAVGALVSFKTAYKKAEVKYAQLAEEEITEVREHYLAKTIADEPKPELSEVVEQLGYVPPPQPPLKAPVPITETRNVFEADPLEVQLPEWDYSVELKGRSETRPYVIHQDEYTQGEPEYETSTLTYFAGDDVLCDERDSPIDNRDEMVGEVNLAKFGHGSGDPNTVYIRNDALERDIEIVHSEGHFAQEVHGFEPPEDEGLRHSDRRRRQRFDDE